MDESIFRAYDVRGIYPDQIDEDAVRSIAKAYAAFVRPKTVAVGRDVRTSGPQLQKAVIEGLLEAGVNVVDIGPVPTDALYFAVGHYQYDGGIQVSASHNPAEYNGLKMVRAGAEAISSETGLMEIKRIAQGSEDLSASSKGELQSRDITEDYLATLANFAEFESLTGLSVVANNNFGLTGPLVEKLLRRLGAEDTVKLIKLNFEPDGTFPKGRPDPLLGENRLETVAAIKNNAADMAVAWDADGDRCFFADENRQFIEGGHLTAFLASHLLKNHPGGKVLYDPRHIWAVEDTVKAAGGQAVMTKAGHTFIKNRMKKEDAVFAGETSGHYYFRDFFYADNGIVPFLIMLNIMAANPGVKLSQLVAPLRSRYFMSEQLNFTVPNVAQALKEVETKYADGEIDRTDGLSITFLSPTDGWRFNLRPSNTEPLLRLNVEGRSEQVVKEKTAELKALIEN